MRKNCTLFIDTTNNYCYLAVSYSCKILKKAKLPVNKNVTDIIVDSIHQLLKQAKVKPTDLTHLVLNIGPGSFTGDKVGVTVAKAWKLFDPRIEIMTINSLLLQTKDGNGISVIDAKSNKLYLAVYKNEKEIVKPCLINQKDLTKYTKKYSHLPLIKDQTNNMYDNFLKHTKSFKKVQDIKYLEPLYLKNPIQ
ncbi:MAG: tRNA (adenosine(37)-N6)-threonylcarbamoyltransferase complex dimerization subunit type 1 TsaB [Mycoplasmoidaceae bacterium]